jgi:hypothetical protein
LRGDRGSGDSSCGGTVVGSGGGGGSGGGCSKGLPPISMCPCIGIITDSLFQIKQSTGQRGVEGGACLALVKLG